MSSLESLTISMSKFIQAAQSKNYQSHRKREMKLFSTKETCGLLQKSTTSIYKCEDLGVIPHPARKQNGRRVGYTLSDINKMRKHFNIKLQYLSRVNANKAVKIGVYNPNHRESVTMTTVNLCYFLSISGYRTLLIDMSAQACVTSMFVEKPDFHFEFNEVISGCLHSDDNTLNDVIRRSHVDGLDYIPSNYTLSALEFLNTSYDEYMNRLDDRIKTVESDYDFVVINAPQGLNILSLQVLTTAEHLITPCLLEMNELASIEKSLSLALLFLKNANAEKRLKSCTLIPYVNDTRTKTELNFNNAMHQHLDIHACKHAFVASKVMRNLKSKFCTPWEQQNYNHCDIARMSDLFNEVLFKIMHNFNNE